jgi:SAM-dependent methyltransferase
MTGLRMNYDALAADYARHRRVHPEVLRRLAEGAAPAARVLEVGCGTGNYAAALRAATGCATTGIDPSERMLAMARRAGGGRFAAGRAERLAVADSAFDLLFSVDVIHHVADRDAAFAEARRALAPGGRVCTVTDSEWIIRNRVPLSRYFPDTVEPELARYPRDGELRARMERAGFSDVREEAVEFAYDLLDSGPYRDKAYSALRLISEAAFQRGLQALEDDLRRGPVRCVSRYVMVWGNVHE